MRPIKFRVWDGEKMHGVSRIDFMAKGYWIEPLDINPQGFLGDRYKALMQFTGLHDKNGKEVYEGDIVKFSGDDHVRTAEEADRPVQKITWGSRGWNAPQSIETRWEIIGNVWES